MPLETVTFDGWEGGEFGELGSREAAKKAIGQERRVRLSPGFWLPTQFNGKNVMRYRDGLLGPRPGVKNLGITGLGNGKIKAHYGASDVGFVIVIGSTVYSFPVAYGGAATAWTMTDAIADPLTKPAEMVGIGNFEYVLAFGFSTYKLTNSTKTCAKIPATATSMPAGRCTCLYQDRQLIGGEAATPYRLRYSDPGSAGWETFPATSYYDIPGFAITFMIPFRSGLLVGTQAGSFVYITGTLGSSAVIRTLTYQGAPSDTAKAKLLATDEVVYMAHPQSFISRYNGAVGSQERPLKFAGNNYELDSDQTPKYRALKLLGNDDWIFLSGSQLTGALNRALLHYDSVYTYHQWEQNIGAWGDSGGPGQALLVKDGTAGTPPVFYVFDPEVQRPGFTTDANARPGDDSTTPLDAYAHLNQFFDPQGKELHVTGVIVDFKKWNTGAAATNHFDVTVRALGRYSNVPTASQTLAWDEAGASSSATGDDYRTQFGFGDQGHGSGFEIWLDNIRGVAIRSITVIFDRSEAYTH